MNSAFTYFESTPYDLDKDSFVALVPKGINDTDKLFDCLYDILQLPGYFSFNWNAVYDCLRDFHWVNEHTVYLIHEDLPDIGSPDTEIYLDILNDAVLDWKTGEEHRLVVGFPLDFQVRIESLLASYTQKN